MRKFTTTSAVLLTGALALTGCAGNDKTDGSHHRSAASSTKPSGDSGDLKDPVGAIKSIKDVKCSADAHGAWSATGRVENGEGVASKYLVEFAVVKQKTSEVMGSKSKEVSVAAGKSAKIDLGNLYKGDQKGLICVPRVLRGAAS
jgi:hypothetical protein